MTGAAESGELGPDAVRREVRAWLAEHWTEGTDPHAWRVIVAEGGWAAPTWPAQWYGRGYSGALAQVVATEFQLAGAPHPMLGRHADSMVRMFGNVLLEHGTKEQK